MFQTKSVFKLYAYVPDQMRILLLFDHMGMAINKLIILKLYFDRLRVKRKLLVFG